MKVRKMDIGRWVQVKYDDIGRMDGLLVKINNNNLATIYFPNDRTVDTFVCLSQITEMGKYAFPMMN